MLRALLQRERWIVLACLVMLSLSGWWYLIGLSGSSGMAMEMRGMPGMMAPPPPMKAAFGATILMWFGMMVAMMLPSAAPMILIYERFAERSRAAGGALLPTALFAAIYLVVWAGFSFLASLAQLTLSQLGLVDAVSLAIGDRRLSGLLLFAAAVYQLTPAKRACLDNCRSPLGFLQREWGPGWSDALRLGFKHGAYCVGCCWLIMALLFVGGVMNLVWIAILAVIVLAEKVAPVPNFTRYAIALCAFSAGIYLLLN